MPDAIDLAARFEQARADSLQLPEKPPAMTLLRLYALYKQGSVGDVDTERPGATQFVERAKWDAWSALAGEPRDDAMRSYVELVALLKAD